MRKEKVTERIVILIHLNDLQMTQSWIMTNPTFDVFPILKHHLPRKVIEEVSHSGVYIA